MHNLHCTHAHTHTYTNTHTRTHTHIHTHSHTHTHIYNDINELYDVLVWDPALEDYEAHRNKYDIDVDDPSYATNDTGF